MAVNTNFYAVANELFARATNGTITTVVDYDSFIDAGKKLADMTASDLQNTLIPELMNKIQKTLNDNPSYMGQLLGLDKGRLDYGVLEIIVNDFYAANASVWDGNTIVEGQTYTDQFKVENLPNASARYYSLSDSWGFDITVRDTDLKGAFQTPDKFDAFIKSMFTSVANSIESYKENVRLSVLADIIVECTAAAAATSEDDAAVRYPLVTLYNAAKGTTLTDANAQLNNDFMTWSAGVIADICELAKKPSKLFSVAGDVTTFTPEAYNKLYINSVFEKNMKRSLVDAFNKEYGMINREYESIPYWQNSKDRMRVTSNKTGSTTYSGKVVAVMMDSRAGGILTQLDEVSTDRNGKYRYTNYHYQLNWMLYTMLSANTIIFTLE